MKKSVREYLKDNYATGGSNVFAQKFSAAYADYAKQREYRDAVATVRGTKSQPTEQRARKPGMQPLPSYRKKSK